MSRPDKATLDAIQERVIALLNGLPADATGDAFIDVATSLGLKHSYCPDTMCHVKVWEHPRITEYNAGLSDRQILGHMYCTLYRWDQEDIQYLKFIIGRIGNTHTYQIPDPVRYW